MHISNKQYTIYNIHISRVLPEEGAAVATTSKSKVCRDYCGSGVTVLLNTTHVVVSNDGLETTLQLNLDSELIDTVFSFQQSNPTETF